MSLTFEISLLHRLEHHMPKTWQFSHTNRWPSMVVLIPIQPARDVRNGFWISSTKYVDWNILVHSLRSSYGGVDCEEGDTCQLRTCYQTYSSYLGHINIYCDLCWQVGPPNSAFIKSNDINSWAPKAVAQSVLADKSTAVSPHLTLMHFIL